MFRLSPTNLAVGLLTLLVLFGQAPASAADNTLLHAWWYGVPNMSGNRKIEASGHVDRSFTSTEFEDTAEFWVKVGTAPYSIDNHSIVIDLDDGIELRYDYSKISDSLYSVSTGAKVKTNAFYTPAGGVLTAVWSGEHTVTNPPV
jgi:hypothetical protein